jgi:hypothetical protein
LVGNSTAGAAIAAAIVAATEALVFVAFVVGTAAGGVVTALAVVAVGEADFPRLTGAGGVATTATASGVAMAGVEDSEEEATIRLGAILSFCIP